ncbi:MAG: oligosaccharide flippase family protein [Candidatus Cloacimonetes bacterium]|nr:oligosaccharide flippase family protein [Candidatus Cloacimonadota bacterium]
MRLKDFIKSLSIYGILPVFTKFASFLLVPIYVRVFSSHDFGVVELIISSANFLIFAINLEFYGAVGRFFFECDGLKEKRKLISTGMIMTLAAAVVILIFAFLFRQQIAMLMFKEKIYTTEVNVGIIWAVFAAISTYLSVLPRYLKKAKLFVLYNALSFLTKLVSTIVYVVVLKMGILGAVLGNLTGAILSTILYGSISLVYLRPVFSTQIMKDILKFSIPLVPGLFLVGFYQPTMRVELAKIYSFSELGLFSFALKLVSIMALIENSIRLSWRPMLYENIKKQNFGKEYFRISRFVGKILIASGIVIAVFTPELIRVIGTVEYYDSGKLVGLLLIGNILANLEMLRGFGFEVAKKTYYLSILSALTFVVGVSFLRYVSPLLGFIGIGFAFTLPNLIKYLITFGYTQKVINRKDRYFKEYWLWALLVLASILLIIETSIFIRLPLLLILVLSLQPWQHRHHLKKVKYINKKVNRGA